MKFPDAAFVELRVPIEDRPRMRQKLDLKTFNDERMVIYAGDDGGVMCHLAFGEEDKEEVFLVSITHLAFDRRLPVARKIAAYQKHRIKRLRRDGSTDAPAAYH